MNHFFYESRGKEKVRELMREGLNSQEYSRSGAHKSSLLNGLSKLFLLLSILGILELLIP